MFRFKKVGDKHYKYRGVDVTIQADEQGKATMLAKVQEPSGDTYQIYCNGIEFDKVKDSITDRIDEYFEELSEN